MKKIILAGCLMAGVTLFASASGPDASNTAPTQDTSHHKMMQKKKMTTTDTSMHHKGMKKMKKDSSK